MTSMPPQKTAWLKMLFWNEPWPITGTTMTNLQASLTAGDLYLSLHTVAGRLLTDQSSYELNYTGYARRPVARDSSEWSIVGTKNPIGVRNVNTIQWAVFTGGLGGEGQAKFSSVGIGSAATGAGTLIATSDDAWFNGGLVSGSGTISPGDAPRIRPEGIWFNIYG